MNLDDLDFHYPERLVATERVAHSRVMWVDGAGPRELTSIEELLEQFASGDCLVVNNTKVLKRRVFSESGLEILFIRRSPDDAHEWEVLCPSSRWKEGTEQVLPGGVRLQILARGRPQRVRSGLPLDEAFFEKHGDLPLPPYIQKARGERRNREGDTQQYQTEWAAHPGSLAAPTASLHFSTEQLASLRAKGVHVVEVTLHVGLGTFLPITTENLDEHVMHSEIAEIPAETWAAIQNCRKGGAHVWALGTTVTRTLESAAIGKLQTVMTSQGEAFTGSTDLFIRPGFEFKVVDRLLTNFHQPRSTLLALVGAFVGLDRVKSAYAWAIEHDFRLFSYGDLTAWKN